MADDIVKLEQEMQKIKEITNALLLLENDSANINKIQEMLCKLTSHVNSVIRPGEKQFIIDEIKKSGYPFETYVQWILATKGWHVQPNIYYPDKESNNGRELDIKAYKPMIVSTNTDFYLNLIIQCKKIPGNVWVFFQSPQEELFYPEILRASLADFLDEHRDFTHDIFEEEGTHFDEVEATVGSHCEIIIDKNLSNKQTNNLWESQLTLLKAVSHELEKYNTWFKESLEELANSNLQKRFPDDIIEVFYPVVVFDGRLYEAHFKDGKISSNYDLDLKPRDYVRLRFDYHSSFYKGNYFIDVVTKDKLDRYLNIVEYDLQVFDERRNECKGYEKHLKKSIEEYCRKRIAEKSVF